MKKLLLLFFGLSLFTLTGCIDIVEELYLNQDGSGRYTLTMDMSALMKDGGIRSMLKQFGEMEGETEGLNMENLDLDKPLEMDTVFTFQEIPDSVRERFDDPELLRRTRVLMKASEADETMAFTFEFNFNELEEIGDFYDNLSKVQDANAGMLGQQSSMLPMGQKVLFQLKGRKLERLPSTQEASDMLSGEDKEMAKMFFTGATYTTIYHLPGKVKKATNPKAEIDGNTVTVAVPMLDVLDEKAELEGMIKFKRK